MKKIKKIYIAIFCAFVCLAVLVYYYYFICLSKSPFYALLQDVEDKKLDMEVCYFEYALHNFKKITNIYTFCNDDRRSNKAKYNLKQYHQKIRYDTYKSSLQNAIKNSTQKLSTKETKPLRSDIETLEGFYSGVAIFFTKYSKPIYEIKLGICPKINGKNYEYNEDFYATLESIVATQDPARAKRILTYKKSHIHNDKTSCLDFYIAKKEKYFLHDKRVQAIEKVYYDCLDFINTDKKECEARRERDMWVLENEFDEDKERKYFLGE